MSSTTRRAPRERGQVLVLFAGGLVLFLAIAALVFDVGQNLLDRRTEQNVADASALAGARYVHGAAYVYHGGCATAPGGMPAVNMACEVASDSGYVDGTGSRTVRIDLPPIAPSTFSGLPGYIEVTIGSTRPSFFAGVLGFTTQRTGATGVATNQSDIALPYSLLALDPHGCGTNKITGSTGTIVSTNGTVHVDSDCPTDAVLLSGNGVLTAPECDVVGMIQTSGGAVNNCTTAPSGVLVSGDPLRNLPPPAKPALPSAVQAIDSTGAVCPVPGVGTCGPIPNGCPGGSSPATETSPAVCSFAGGFGGAIAGKTYRIFPGYYPGGILTDRATVYMDPGIYWIGGGGITVKNNGGSNNGQLISKAPGDNSGLTPTGGVLIYDSIDPYPTTGCTGAGCFADIQLNGGAGAELGLRPIQTTIYKGMLIFVDRAVPVGTLVVDLNGAGSILDVTGTIYTATGSVKFNGSSTDVIGTQVICYNFLVNGSGASFTMDYNPADLFHVTGVGLVQ
ncbi:MAG TPA: pilus assembly protein TadG-related protein [Verrucomicrobiae bacterium]|nr:pilus assembly protein TadG-related protein [Verrucomicrobiae bacterium]